MYTQVNLSEIKPYLPVIWLKSGLDLQPELQQSAGSPRMAEGALQSRRWTDDFGGGGEIVPYVMVEGPQFFLNVFILCNTYFRTIKASSLYIYQLVFTFSFPYDI